MINTKLLRITRHVLAAVVVLVSLPGCGPRPVQGGTAGHLLSAGNPLPDVRVTVFQGEGSAYTPLGFGVTTNDGSFQLFQNQARGPLVLTAGEYHFTLESAGAPIQIPPRYAKPETSPLKASWDGGGAGLDLAVAEKLVP